MKNMKISAKLITSFSIIILLSIIVGVFGIYGVYQINEADDGLYNENYLPTVLAGNISQLIVQQRMYIRNLIIYDVNIDAESFNNTLNSLSKSKTELDNYLKEYESSITSNEDKSIYDEIVKVYYQEWIPAVDSITKLGTENKTQDAKQALVGSSLIATNLDELTTELQNHNLVDGEITVKNNSNLFMTMIIVISGILVFTILFSMTLAFYISKLIGKPIRNMVEVANKIAVGDINTDIDNDRKDETGDLANAFNNMVKGIRAQVKVLESVAEGDLTAKTSQRSDNDTMGKALVSTLNQLNDIFTEINIASQQVNSGGAQVSDAAQALSQGATEQASAIEELSASIQEISEQVKENASSAEMVTKLSDEAGKEVVRGNEHMNLMLSAMNEIKDSSNEISKIIKVIDEIAFQTNILALNAAVEAARAGAAGKGFAVVADEVRNLASKSADAANQTTALIEGSIKSVENGANIAQETAHSLELIADKTKQVSKLITQIASASIEQSQGISQINLGVEQISQVVQTNSATAEESAAASEELSGQANILQEQISRFKLRSKDKSLGIKL